MDVKNTNTGTSVSCESEVIDSGRRQALARLGLAAAVGYAVPTLLSLTAHASSSDSGSGGGGDSGGDSGGASGSSGDSGSDDSGGGETPTQPTTPSSSSDDTGGSDDSETVLPPA